MILSNIKKGRNIVAKLNKPLKNNSLTILKQKITLNHFSNKDDADIFLIENNKILLMNR